jgi:hypothetical protein
MLLVDTNKWKDLCEVVTKAFDKVLREFEAENGVQMTQ